MSATRTQKPRETATERGRDYARSLRALRLSPETTRFLLEQSGLNRAEFAAANRELVAR